MRTAETIISEYLERGYGMESLRALAESRSEPLASEMKEILDTMQAENEPLEVACEPGTVDAGGEMLFFVAADEQCAAEGDARVDFDVLAGSFDDSPDVGQSPPVAFEESVADIVIGEAAGSEVVTLLSSGKGPAPLPEFEPEMLDEAFFATEPEALEAETPEVVDEQPSVPEASASEPAVTEPEALKTETPEVVDEQPSIPEAFDSETAVALPDVVGPRAISLPNSAPIGAEFAALPLAPATDAATVDAAEGKAERKERRRRDRKKGRATRHEERISGKAATLPEIVLTCAEGTDTLREMHASESDKNNVILFRSHYPLQALERDAAEEDEENSMEQATLRLLPQSTAEEDASPAVAVDDVEDSPEEEAADGAGDAVAETVDAPEDGAETEEAEAPSAMTPFLSLADAETGEEALEARSEAAEEDADSVASQRYDQEALAELEREYQEKLDGFAARLLEVQAAGAKSEVVIRDREADLAAARAEMEAMRGQLRENQARVDALTAQLAESVREGEGRAEELRTFAAMRGEHERLYAEFEDLRKAYNEIVTEVMPELQGERDDLAMTVESQCAEEERLRTSLSTTRKRLVVGYSLGAAALFMMVVLPLMNWRRSGDDGREVAMDMQKAAELKGRLEKAERRNVETEKTLFDLERRVNLAMQERAKLERKNVELARLADQRNKDLAQLRAGAGQTGTPTRASVMALQAAPTRDGKLRVNEVRDPAGQIDHTLAVNRQRQERDEAPGGTRVAVSAVARRDDAKPSATQSPRNEEKTSEKGVATAKVKTGEGVAQVVYRVLGTRDPEVINWVIRENNIQKDRRGNPRIYPEQELRLPQGGRIGQAASR